ncbi:hypothetical protein L208DRAFT_1413387 [Tricholoma matsutake]|nr:hypothetical protein L208DRAFT_1413387 [Tricholoma matsutake 945]
MDIEYVMVRENPPPFDEKRWIGKGKIFPSNSSAFPDLEGYRKRKLFIPEDFYRYAFPNSEVTVKDFLALRLPKESYALVHPSASTCFSTFPANDDDHETYPPCHISSCRFSNRWSASNFSLFQRNCSPYSPINSHCSLPRHFSAFSILLPTVP